MRRGQGTCIERTHGQGQPVVGLNVEVGMGRAGESNGGKMGTTVIEQQ